MTDMTTIRGYFEEVTLSSFAHTKPYNTFKRNPNGEYVNGIIEDHWQTFQEGWASAVEYLVQAQNET